MAKRLGPQSQGRKTQRVRPGLLIRELLINPPHHGDAQFEGVTIGECHRYYLAHLLAQWKQDQVDALLAKSARRSKGMRAARRAIVEQKLQAKIDKILGPGGRKLPPNATTYDSFRRYFNFLVQIGYIQPKRSNGAKVRMPPEMKDGRGMILYEERRLRAEKERRGMETFQNIEPPVIYEITDMGRTGTDWDNPKRGL